jgi:glycosyltransferase A (GT-A) superfamily protein (DUF2064 family)
VSPAAVIVLAKAPEPGRVKTRLCPPATPDEAADLAAASLLDTIDAAAGVPGAELVVALSGRLAGAVRRAELTAALRRARVLPQRGNGLGARIAAAHTDTAAQLPGRPTLQLGMDTPQAGPALLAACLDRLGARSTDAVLGPAADGGWWAMGLRDPRAARLVAAVPTSRADTGERTLRALRDGGLRVGLLPELTDVDTAADALVVAAAAPGGRFAAALARCPAFAAAS